MVDLVGGSIHYVRGTKMIGQNHHGTAALPLIFKGNEKIRESRRFNFQHLLSKINESSVFNFEVLCLPHLHPISFQFCPTLSQFLTNPFDVEDQEHKGGYVINYV